MASSVSKRVLFAAIRDDSMSRPSLGAAVWAGACAGETMRVVMVAHTDAPWTKHYARAFEEAGHDVLVLSFCPDPIEGFRTEFIGRHPYDPGRGKHLFVTRAPRIRQLAKTFGADVLFAPYLISNALAAALGWQGPLVISARGADVVQQDGTMRIPAPVRKVLVRALASRSVHIHSVADELTDAMVAMGVSREQIQTFPIGINLDLFAPRQDPGSLHDPPRLLCTRKHRPVYAIPVLVRALKLLSDQGQPFHCTFVGGGEQLDDTRAMVSEAGLDEQVELTGHVTHDQIAQHIASNDIYVSCSTADGTSSALLEGLAGGLFPVVSRIEANLPWVHHGENGLLFDCGDAAGLAQALRRAIDDEVLRRNGVRGNRAMVQERADMKKNMDRLVAMLADAAGIAPSPDS